MALSPSLTDPPRSLRGTRTPCFNGCLRCLRSVCLAPVEMRLLMLATRYNTRMIVQVASATPSAAREDTGWMDLLQFVTPSSAATGPPPQQPEPDSAALLVFLDAYQVRWCTLRTPLGIELSPHMMTTARRRSVT